MILPNHIANPDPNIYLSNNYLVIDVETTSLDKGDPNNANNALLLSVSSGNSDEFRVEWGSEYEARRTRSAVGSVDFIVAHNAKFELGWLVRCGIDLTKIVVWDTMIGEYIRAGNRKFPLDLSSCSARYRGLPKTDLVNILIKGGIDPKDIPNHWLEKYCIQDVKITKELFLKQRKVMQEEGLLPVMYTRCLFTPVLTDIESKGMQLDEGRVYEEYNNVLREYNGLQTEIQKFTGGINTNSPKQLAELLYDRLGFSELKDPRGNAIRTTANGRKTDAPTIAKLTCRNKRQREFIRLRSAEAKLNTKLTNYLNKYKSCCDENGGLLHASFNQTITQTHRLSSTGKRFKAQFQNFDRTFKRMFKARNKGWKIAEADQAQLEFRTAANHGNDEIARDAIISGFDVHSFTRDTITEAGQSINRQEAKAHTFKPLFGGSSGTDAERAYYEAFRKRYPGIAAEQNSWIDEVLSTKKLKTITGLKFYWPDTKITRSGWVTNTPAICNYPIQYFSGAEIVPIGITYLWHRMKAAEMQSILINTIHDSVIAELKPEEEEKYVELAELSLVEDVYKYLDTVYNIQFDVPLEIELKISDHWGE